MYVGRKSIIFSLVVGLALTFLTSFLINNVVIGEFPNIRFVSLPIIGVNYWGYPLPWLKQVVYPGELKVPIWSHFVIDIAYWTGLVLIIKVFYLKRVRPKEIVKEKVPARVEPAKPARPVRPVRPVRKRRPPKRKKKTTRRKSTRRSARKSSGRSPKGSSRRKPRRTRRR